jgi:transcriptional repressor NrdR
VIRRRRECNGCGRRFTSYEQIEDIPSHVVKRDGRREPFSRKKLLAGLLTASEKRPIAIASLEGIVDAIEAELSRREEREMSTEDVGAAVMARLRDLDQVAYVRFASVYRKFNDIETFMGELKSLLADGETPRRTPRARRGRTP